MNNKKKKQIERFPQNIVPYIETYAVKRCENYNR